MANEVAQKQYLDYTGLAYYDTELKKYLAKNYGKAEPTTIPSSEIDKLFADEINDDETGA